VELSTLSYIGEDRSIYSNKNYRYDKVYRLDILNHAYNLVTANKGAPGIDGETFESIEEREGGVKGYLEDIAGELKRKEYKPKPVRRVYIPKASEGGWVISITATALLPCRLCGHIWSGDFGYTCAASIVLAVTDTSGSLMNISTRL